MLAPHSIASRPSRPRPTNSQRRRRKCSSTRGGGCHGSAFGLGAQLSGAQRQDCAGSAWSQHGLMRSNPSSMSSCARSPARVPRRSNNAPACLRKRRRLVISQLRSNAIPIQPAIHVRKSPGARPSRWAGADNGSNSRAWVSITRSMPRNRGVEQREQALGEIATDRLGAEHRRQVSQRPEARELDFHCIELRCRGAVALELELRATGNGRDRCAPGNPRRRRSDRARH